MIRQDHPSLFRGFWAAAAIFGSLSFGSAALAQEGPPPPATPPAGCQKDTDCKGDRVCTAGKCVNAAGPAAAPSPDGPPPPYGPPDGRASRGSYYDYKVQVAQDPRLIKDWQEGDPIPEGYVRTKRVRRGLVGAGAGLLGGFWVLSVITGAIIYDADCHDLNYYSNGVSAPCQHNNWPLFVPIVGPFIDIGTAGANATGGVFLALDGVVQAGGLAMLIAGAVSKQTVLVRAAGVEIKPMPLFGRGQTGLGLSGSF